MYVFPTGPAPLFQILFVAAITETSPDRNIDVKNGTALNIIIVKPSGEMAMIR